MLVGKKLKYYRKLRGLSQEKLAERICDTSYISKIENNKIEAPEETLMDLCHKLNIKLNDLLEDTDTEKLNLLDEWYRQIEHQNERESTSILIYLKPMFDHVTDPVLLFCYYLYRLYFSLQFKSYEFCNEMLHKIRIMVKYGVQENEYDYNLILGLY